MLFYFSRPFGAHGGRFMGRRSDAGTRVQCVHTGHAFINRYLAVRIFSCALLSFT
jgi:hypothetical protein